MNLHCWGEGIFKEFGCYIQNGRPTRTSYITHGTRFSVLRQLQSGVSGAGRYSERMNACICTAESFHCSPGTLTTLLIGHVLSGLSCPTLCNPIDCSLTDSSVRGDSPGKNTGVGCHALLQGIFLTQESIGGGGFLLHCRQILYQLSYQGSPNWLYPNTKQKF